MKYLFDEAGLPKPFSKAPRLTIYRRELYDYAECINLATLLSGRFPQLDDRLETVLDDITTRWQRLDGSFRSRHLLFGWDNVPMHRRLKRNYLEASVCCLHKTPRSIDLADFLDKCCVLHIIRDSAGMVCQK